MLGTSAMSYSADTHAKHYSCEWPQDNPELGVTMMPHNLRRKDGSVVYTHAIAINCSGYIFTIVNAFPELGRVDLGESVLYKLQHETDYGTLDVEKARASSSLSSLSDAGSVRSVQGLPIDNSTNSLLDPKLPRVTKESLHKTHVYTARASRIKACMILNHARGEEHVHGPTVEFVTNTIGHIYSGDVDAHELVDRSFFSLVVPEDLAKAAAYMDSLIKVARPQLCSLRLVRRPIVDEQQVNTGGLANSAGGEAAAADEPIEIEVFGASSGDKIMLLCQRVRRNWKSSVLANVNRHASFNDDDDDLPYMSLEDIISSDPDSSDLNDQWYEVAL
ncbi:hypothetical protein GGF43_000596 [Coemansia sp. RSA 2618]|nr:hypothetical protein GGF43_000596 [Coemansia sp. RSA 2618]